MKSETHPVSLQSSQTAHTPTVIAWATGGFWREENSGHNSCSYTMDPDSNFECRGAVCFLPPTILEPAANLIQKEY